MWESSKNWDFGPKIRATATWRKTSRKKENGFLKTVLCAD
jgi:hypothetical protein